MTTTTVLMIIIALNALATINLWREAARRPARPSEKFVKALLRSEPIVPKHGTPTRWTYEDDAYVAKYERTSFGKMIRARRLFFYDFADFAVIVNSWFEKSGDLGGYKNWPTMNFGLMNLRLGSADDIPSSTIRPILA
jgi:hypothetical protein